MTQFVAHPGSEIIGQAIMTMAESGGVFKRRIYGILADCGLKSIDPAGWYEVQLWLNALKIVQHRIGDNTLFLMGKEVANTAQTPPSVDSIETVFAMFPAIYVMNHRGPQPASWRIHKLTEREYRLTNLSPYPHEFNRGITVGFAEKFKPKGAVISVVTEREDSETADYRVTW